MKSVGTHNMHGLIIATAVFTLLYFCLIPVFCIEDNTDRQGGDYRHFDLASPNPSLCEQACAGDPNCQAFTYVRPGFQGANPQCWLKNTVSVSTSNNCCISGVKTALSGGSSPAPSNTMEDNTDRQGGDYRHFDLASPNPSLCEQACAGDPNCQAFTYVRPGFQGANPQCWLKNTVSVSTSNNCCISGVKTALSGGSSPAPSNTMEDNTDRQGGDYRHFDLASPNPSLCEQACAGDPNCQAFTYVRPGFQGTNPQCWLKNTVPVSTSNNCCMSGVKT